MLGLAAALGLGLRQSLLLVGRFRQLQRDEGMAFGEDLVRRGLADRFRAIVGSAGASALLALPFVVMGDVAGLEILHGLAVTLLGALVTSTLMVLCGVPALFLRFADQGVAADLDLALESGPQAHRPDGALPIQA